MPALIRAHLATQPDSALLESLAMLADRALASELVGLLEDLYTSIKKTRDSGIHYGRREEEEYRTCSDK